MGKLALLFKPDMKEMLRREVKPIDRIHKALTFL